MAAALLPKHLRHPRGTSRVESAGLAALAGSPADPFAVALMWERGIDISSHRGRQLTHTIAEAFELILVMEEGHAREVEKIFPAGRGRVRRLGHFGNFDVPDPYRQPRAAFERSLALIERGIDDFVRAFWSPK